MNCLIISRSETVSNVAKLAATYFNRAVVEDDEEPNKETARDCVESVIDDYYSFLFDNRPNNDERNYFVEDATEAAYNLAVDDFKTRFRAFGGR